MEHGAGAVAPASAAVRRLDSLPAPLLTRIARYVYGTGEENEEPVVYYVEPPPRVRRLAALRACCRAFRAAVDALGVVSHLKARARHALVLSPLRRAASMHSLSLSRPDPP
jgi:hypothetical protein